MYILIYIIKKAECLNIKADYVKIYNTYCDFSFVFIIKDI